MRSVFKIIEDLVLGVLVLLCLICIGTMSAILIVNIIDVIVSMPLYVIFICPTGFIVWILGRNVRLMLED